MSDEREIGEARTVSNAFPANSRKSKEEKVEPKPEVEKVTSGAAVQRKKPLGKRIAETFTGDSAKSVGDYVLFDVILPAAKAMISDAASQGVERMLFGDVKGRSRPVQRGGGSTFANRTNYSGVSRPEVSMGADRRQMSNRGKANHEFDEIILPERGEAEAVIDRLSDLVEKYESASVADLYALVGITGGFTDNKWGWYDLRQASISRIREGYLLNLPQPEPID